MIDLATDYGTVQNAIGKLLAGTSEQFWVDAQRDGISSPSFYKYAGDSERPTYHTTTDHNGDCLTYSSDTGSLNTAVRRRRFMVYHHTLSHHRAIAVGRSGDLCATGETPFQ